MQEYEVKRADLLSILRAQGDTTRPRARREIGELEQFKASSGETSVIIGET